MWWVALLISSIITIALIVHHKSVLESWQLSWYDGGVFAGVMTTIGIALAPAVFLIVVIKGVRGKW